MQRGSARHELLQAAQSYVVVVLVKVRPELPMNKMSLRHQPAHAAKALLRG